MKRKIFITAGSLIALLLIIRLCVIDIVSVPEGKSPHAGGWAFVSRWAYGYRTPWNASTRWCSSRPKQGEWIAYNQPVESRDAKPNSTTICIGQCMAVAGDTLWYNNETGGIVNRKNSGLGFTHPLIVPQKDKKVKVTNDNIRFYATTIMLHEPVKATIVNDSLCVSGRMTTEYTFQQDYYWMETTDEQDLNDSRSFGFVPHVSLIGKVL